MYTYEVVIFPDQVHDGDTITKVVVDLGFHITCKTSIRLKGVWAKELNSKIEADALLAIKQRDYLIDLILEYGADFILKSERLDKYGRCEGVLISSKLGSVYTINDLLNKQFQKE